MSRANFLFSLLIGILVVLSFLYQPFDPMYPGVNAFITLVMVFPVLALGVYFITLMEERRK